MVLVRKMLLFFVVCLFLHGALYAIFTQKFGKGDLWKAEQQVLYPPQGYRYLFMGDSRANKAVLLDQIPAAQKWAAGGESVAMRYYKLQKLFDTPKAPQPEVLLLSHDFSIYAQSNIDYVRNYYYYNQLIDYADWSETHHIPFAAAQKTYYVYRFFPYIESRDIFLRGMENVFQFGVDNAAQLNEHSAAQNDAIARNFVWNTLLQKKPATLYSHTGLLYLQRIIDLCRRQHLPIILLSYPMPDCTQHIVDSIFPNPPLVSPVDSLLQHYPEVQQWDYSRLFAGKDSLFLDILHLNPQGAASFSQQVAADLACWE